MLSVYTAGAMDGAAMLGRLVENFSQREEPVVLVFFGDHLPYLGDNQLGYVELQSEVAVAEEDRTDVLCSYKTPYVIWANDAAAEALDWDSAVENLDLPENGTLSASFLGAAVLELTGRADEDPWFRFLNDLRRVTPVVQKKTYMLPGGVCWKDSDLAPLPAEGDFPGGEAVLELTAKWRQWSYYNLRYQEFS